MIDPARSLHILLELQRMAAEKYAQARRWLELADNNGDTWEGDEYAECAYDCQREAAALSRLVRIGLGIEEP
jgi:hypothetical protein